MTTRRATEGLCGGATPDAQADWIATLDEDDSLPPVPVPAATPIGTAQYRPHRDADRSPAWRGVRRIGMMRDGSLRTTILDVGREGFRLPPVGAVSVGATVLIDLPTIGARRAVILRQAGPQLVGLWTEALSEAEAERLGSNALLVAMLAVPRHGHPEPDIERFPAIVRFGSIVGLSVLLWCLFYAARRL